MKLNRTQQRSGCHNAFAAAISRVRVVTSSFLLSRSRWCFLAMALTLSISVSSAEDEPFAEGFQWTASEPLIAARQVDGLPWHAIKDPSIVRVGNTWHLFATVRGSERSHAIVYLSFPNWKDANTATQHVLPMHSGYFCAPQVFWFEPAKKWYLVCQASNQKWGNPPYRPAWSTTSDIADPTSWTPLTPFYKEKPNDDKSGLDFWVICDDQKAHLFYTSLDGRMWRMDTPLEMFPTGWTKPKVVLQDRIFEASHTYKLKGRNRFLTVIEEQNGYGWRFIKAYTASSLDGEWSPLAATKEDSFASMKNVLQPAGRWTGSISHVEIIRTGIDQRLEIDPDHLQVVFQGALEEERQGRKYGNIPWRLGILTATPTDDDSKSPEN